MSLPGKRAAFVISLAIGILLLVGCEAPYANPPESLQAADLVGTWFAQYGGAGREVVVLAQDGTFQQTYEGIADGERNSSSNGQWRLQRLDNGYVRLELSGGRYYAMGTGYGDFTAFYDPFLQQSLFSDHAIYLHVRRDSSGKLLLHHLFDSVDAGFPIFGANRLIFRRLDQPE